MLLSSSLSDKTTPASHALSNFMSQWFLIPQGTGMTAIVLKQLRYQFTGLKIISQILWVLAIILLVFFLTLYLLRIIVFPSEVRHALRTNANETAGLASISITITTLIQMIALNLVDDWGARWGLAAYVLWWINVALATTAAIGIPFVFVRYDHPGRGDPISPATQLPLIAALTAAAGGGVICRYAEVSARLQVPVIIVSYLLIGLVLPVALVQNMTFMKDITRLPDLDGETSRRDRLLSCQEMILCGPWGQCSFALQILGQVVLRGSFKEYSKGMLLTGEAAPPIAYVSMFAGVLAWGQATFWWAFAILSIVIAATEKRDGRRRLRFGLAAWGIVFPWGVYTNAANSLGLLFDSPAFDVWSTVLAIVLIVVWATNISLTIRGVITGELLGLDRGWRILSQLEDGKRSR